MRHFASGLLEMLGRAIVIDTGHSGGCELAQVERIASDGIAAHNAVTAISAPWCGYRLKNWRLGILRSLGFVLISVLPICVKNPSPLLELLNVGHFNGIRWRWWSLAASHDCYSLKKTCLQSVFNMGSDSYCDVSSELSKQILSLIASLTLQFFVADFSVFWSTVSLTNKLWILGHH